MALALVSVAVGLAVVFRSRRSPGATSRNTESGLLRLRAEVKAGFEQTIVRTLQPLHLPDDETEIGYGQLFRQSAGDGRVIIRSRSMLDRGLVSVLGFTFTGRSTSVTFSILRLPGDERVNTAVLQLETSVIRAVRQIDPNAEVHLFSSSPRSGGSDLPPTDQPS